MRKGRIVLLAGALGLLGGCQDFLDVNTNPNAPETVAANLYLPPMLSAMVTAPIDDGRVVGRYTQQLLPTFSNNFARMGYDRPPSGDFGTQQWRDVYWVMGQNLVDMMELAAREERWDILGVGYILKAWGWQALAGQHGEIIVKEAIDQTKFNFNYDPEQVAYEEARRLLDSAIVLLGRTDGAVDATFMGRGDKIYNGDRTKWLKFAHGLMAINLNRYTNKSSYDPAAVIAAVDRSLASNADDALLLYPGNTGADANFMGQLRGLWVSYRQSRFVVELMDGTQFGGAVDPRMPLMLSPAPDGKYRGSHPNNPSLFQWPASQRPNNPYGYPGAVRGDPGIYLFDDGARVPAMTYSQLQFTKAEAAYRAGDKATALTAYRNGISSHIDFVNARNAEAGRSPLITATAKAAFLANPAIVPTAAGLTLTHIMSQKFIAQWAWGHNEQWMDMRRYHYTDIDPASGRQVYAGFDPPSPTVLDVANQGKFVYRIRPRYNSEYVWNFPALVAIGADAEDYHTKPLWIIQP